MVIEIEKPVTPKKVKDTLGEIQKKQSKKTLRKHFGKLKATISLLLFFCSFHSLIAQKQSDKEYIHNHLINITKTDGFRNYQNIEILDQVADYIYYTFQEYCDTVYFQNYTAGGHPYKNVIGSIGVENEKRVVVGAHYDVYGEQEGADDNASGVVGLLELARLLSGEKLEYRIDFVAYSLEEPPYFRTNNMGSYVHAKSLSDANASLLGMICLEMIGYFSEEPKSQSYPLPHKKIIYGDEADFIMIVQKMNNNSFSNQMKGLMKSVKLIDTKSIKAPASIPGIDFSDHLNYWAFGYDAFMITNTSFYRNPHYHQPTDTIETLNLDKMAAVIDQVYYALLNFKNKSPKKKIII